MVIVVVVVCSSCGAKMVQRVEVKGTGVGVSVHASPILKLDLRVELSNHHQRRTIWEDEEWPPR